MAGGTERLRRSALGATQQPSHTRLSPFARVASILLLFSGVFCGSAAGQTNRFPPPEAEIELDARYRLIRYGETGGSTADNADEIEAYMAASTSVEGAGKVTKPGRIPAGWYPILTTINGPNTSGVRLEGNSCETDAWSQVQMLTLGAGVTQIVMEDTTPPGGTMIEVQAGGMRLSDINIRGYGGSGPLQVWGAKASWATIGIHMLDPDATSGSGKMQGDALGLMALDKGIVCGEDILTGNQADEIVYNRIVGIFINELIETRNQQSVNHHISNLHCYGVETVLNLLGGGTFEIGTCYMGAQTLYSPTLANTLFLKTGDTISANSNIVHVNTLRPDGSMTNLRLWDMETAEQFLLHIDVLDGNDYWDPSTPSELKAGARLHIGSTDSMPDNFINYDQDVGNDGDDGAPIEIVIGAYNVRSDQDVEDIISTGDGTCYVTVYHATTMGSSAAPYGYRQKWVDGTLTEMSTFTAENIKIGPDPEFAGGNGAEITMNDTAPQVLMYENDFTGGSRLWGLLVDGGVMTFQGLNDANSVVTTLLTMSRTGALGFADGIKQIFNPNGTNAGLNVGSQAGDPSSVANGDLWYDSTANTLDARINGATVNLGAGGAGSVATDTIWNAAGDLVQGTGSDTAARLAIGSAGQLLRVNAGATAAEWATVSGTGSMTSVEEDNTIVGGADAVSVDFLGADFDVTAASTDRDVAIAAAITRDAEWDTFTKIFAAASGEGTGVETAFGINIGSAGSFVVNGGALGTPASGTLTNATGLPIATGVSGLGSGVATWLATPSTANLAAAVTGETGSGALMFGTSPTVTTLLTVTDANGSALIRGTTISVNDDATDLTWDLDFDGGLQILNDAVLVVEFEATGNVAIEGTLTVNGGSAVYRAGGTDVPVADGGTGASTLTGLLQGNGTGAFTAVTNSTTVGQILRVTGSNTYGFGAIDLDDTDAFTGMLPGSAIEDASTTNSGDAEAAINTEVDAGTDAARYVTPDALAGSVSYGTKSIELICVDWTTDITTGTKFYYRVPPSLNGFDIVYVNAQVVTAGTTGDTTVQLVRRRGGTPGSGGTAVDVLSGDPLDIASTTDNSDAGDPGTISTSNDDLATDDFLEAKVDAVSTTAPKGLIVTIEARKP